MKRRARWMRRGRQGRAAAMMLVALAPVAAGVASAGEGSALPPDPLAAERFAAMPSQDDVVARDDWYRPQVAIGGAPRAWPRAVAAPPARFAAAREVAARYGTLALLVVQDGRIVLEEYAPGLGPQTRFESNSMHRGLFGLVVAAALEDGVLPSMQATLGTLVPDWFPATDARSRIRVEDLLHGQSGLDDPPFANAADSPGMRLFVGSDLRALVLAQQAVQPAGQRFRGAILDAQLLGLVLEERLRRGGRGGGYAAYLDARIWRPIGAGRATLRLDREGGATRTFCCLQASAPDWARVGQLVLDRGRAPASRGVVLREASIARLLAPAPLNDAVGAFWFLKPTPLAPRSADPSRVLAQATPFAAPGVVYAGARGGQRVYAIPSRRAVVVRFGAMRYDFDDGAFLNPFLEALDAR